MQRFLVESHTGRPGTVQAFESRQYRADRHCRSSHTLPHAQSVSNKQATHCFASVSQRRPEAHSASLAQTPPTAPPSGFPEPPVPPLVVDPPAAVVPPAPVAAPVAPPIPDPPPVAFTPPAPAPPVADAPAAFASAATVPPDPVPPLLPVAPSPLAPALASEVAAPPLPALAVPAPFPPPPLVALEPPDEAAPASRPLPAPDAPAFAPPVGRASSVSLEHAMAMPKRATAPMVPKECDMNDLPISAPEPRHHTPRNLRSKSPNIRHKERAARPRLRGLVLM